MRSAMAYAFFLSVTGHNSRRSARGPQGPYSGPSERIPAAYGLDVMRDVLPSQERVKPIAWRDLRHRFLSQNRGYLDL